MTTSTSNCDESRVMYNRSRADELHAQTLIQEFLLLTTSVRIAEYIITVHEPKYHLLFSPSFTEMHTHILNLVPDRVPAAALTPSVGRAAGPCVWAALAQSAVRQALRSRAAGGGVAESASGPAGPR